MSALLNSVFFRTRVLKRALAILPRREKDIALLSFSSVTDADSHETIIIRYDFANALWFYMDDVPTTEGRHVLLRPSETEQQRIRLTVQGLFRKSNYTILMGPERVLITETVN